jgi:hypothetical protein
LLSRCERKVHRVINREQNKCKTREGKAKFKNQQFVYVDSGHRHAMHELKVSQQPRLE